MYKTTISVTSFINGRDIQVSITHETETTEAASAFISDMYEHMTTIDDDGLKEESEESNKGYYDYMWGEPDSD